MTSLKSFNHILHSKSPLIVEIFDFISDHENQQLFKYIETKEFKESLVVGDEGDPAEHTNNERTSKSIYMNVFENNISEILSSRIADLNNAHVYQLSCLQMIKYVKGEKFTPHYDKFFTDDVSIIGNRGQRLASSLLYLNEDYIGGKLSFPKLDISIKPKKNSLVFFKYDGDGWEDTLHSSGRIIKGSKYAMLCLLYEASHEGKELPTTFNPDIEILTLT